MDIDLDTLTKRLQSHLSDGLVTIVGSGLSCAEGLPGMSQLAEHLCATIGDGLVGDDASLWLELVPLIKSQGLESAMLAKPPTPTLEEAISAQTAFLIGAKEREVISQVFSGSRILRLTRLLSHLLKPSGGLPIVTTNYDRLVEVAVEEAGISADNMFVGRFAGSLNERESKLSHCRSVTIKKGAATFHYRSRALVYKPHGSLDWYFRNGRPVYYGGELSGVARLIITPGQNKFRNGYESPFDHHRSRANESIDRGTRFLIIGYGFNDDHLETHLTPAMRSGRPTVMLTHSLTPKAKELAASLPNVTALEFAHRDAKDGTLITANKLQNFIPGLAIWDLNSFIDEVLEP